MSQTHPAKRPAFVASALRLAQQGHVDPACTVIFSCFAALFAAEAFGLCDLVLEHTEPNTLPNELLFAMLTATLCHAPQLQARAQFLSRVAATLRVRGDVERGALDGLCGQGAGFHCHGEDGTK